MWYFQEHPKTRNNHKKTRNTPPKTRNTSPKNPEHPKCYIQSQEEPKKTPTL